MWVIIVGWRIVIADRKTVSSIEYIVYSEEKTKYKFQIAGYEFQVKKIQGINYSPPP